VGLFATLFGSGCPSAGLESAPLGSEDSGGAGDAAVASDSRQAPLDPFPAPLRLPTDAAPTAYEVHLTIDPAAETFSGSVAIDVELSRPTRLVRLHALDLTIASAVYRRAPTPKDGRPAPSQPVPLTAELDGRGALALMSKNPLPAGPGRLELTFQGPLDEPPVGLYRTKEGEHHYAYTQFEPLEARKAFPCFDEPRFKVPVTTTLTTPAGTHALSNMPELGSDVANGWRTTRFAKSPPMPTYLVALAVGPFDIVDGPRVSSRRVPFRVVTTKGKGPLARFALERTPDHLAFLEGWFGTPYPYPKLDFVAVPSFSSSAMENIGLVTYRDAVLLIDPIHAPLDDRLRGESIIAHELAHMWFGNLVTLAWWDDLWLNEAFAVWMARKAVRALAPDLDPVESIARNKMSVMGADSRPAARAIREPIVDEGDVYNAFDGITYSKGAAVLEMVEQWIGDEVFRGGVRSYLDEHAHGVAATADLLEHLERAATNAPSTRRRPAGELTRILSSFTDKPHVPLVHVDWRCEGERVLIEVAQREWRSLADPRGPARDSPRWEIPMCVKLADERKHLVHCALLSEPRATWEARPGFCPTFSHPNVDEAGYYRWETRLGPVSIARSDSRVMAGYLGNLRAAFEAGDLDVASYVDLVAPLVTMELSPGALADVLGALWVVPGVVPEAATDRRFMKRARTWLSRLRYDLTLGGSARDRRMQPHLIRTFAALEDKKVLTEAARVTSRTLAAAERGEPVDLELANLYLPIHIRALGHDAKGTKARRALWHQLERLVDHRTPGVRNLAIGSLGAFLEPGLVIDSLELVMSGRLRAQDFRTVRGGISSRPEVAQAVWTWLTTRFEPLVERLGAKSAPGLPSLAGGLCTHEHADEVERWFKARAAAFPPGLDRNLALTVDGIRSCAKTRAHHGPSARSWYGAKGAPTR
jgi:alanyl aminopeptidase